MLTERSKAIEFSGHSSGKLLWLGCRVQIDLCLNVKRSKSFEKDFNH